MKLTQFLKYLPTFAMLCCTSSAAWASPQRVPNLQIEARTADGLPVYNEAFAVLMTGQYGHLRVFCGPGIPIPCFQREDAIETGAKFNVWSDPRGIARVKSEYASWSTPVDYNGWAGNGDWDYYTVGIDSSGFWIPECSKTGPTKVDFSQVSGGLNSLLPDGTHRLNGNCGQSGSFSGSSLPRDRPPVSCTLPVTGRELSELVEGTRQQCIANSQKIWTCKEACYGQQFITDLTASAPGADSSGATGILSDRCSELTKSQGYMALKGIDGAQLNPAKDCVLEWRQP